VGRGVSGELARRPRQAPAARPPCSGEFPLGARTRGGLEDLVRLWEGLKGCHATADGRKRRCGGGSAHGGRDGVRARETAAQVAFIARAAPWLHAEGMLIITAAVRRLTIGLRAHRRPATDRGTLHGAVRRRGAQGVSGRGALGRREATLRSRAWGANAEVAGAARSGSHISGCPCLTV
jgi:hypothetical protein